MSEIAEARQKICSRCQKEKPVDEFYMRKDAPDGRLYNCISCAKKYNFENKERIAKQRADAYLDNRESALLIVKKYRKTPIGAKNRKESNARYRKNNPDKVAAHHAINNAIRDGHIARSIVCENCGKNSLTQGHHDDYSRPLEVRWLCEPCHTLHHTGVKR